MITDSDYHYHLQNIEEPRLAIQLLEDVQLIYYGFAPVNEDNGDDLAYMISLYATWKACTKNLK